MRTAIVALATSVIAIAACSDALGPTATDERSASPGEVVVPPLPTTSVLAPMPNKPTTFLGFTSRPFNSRATYLNRSSSAAEGWSGDEASSRFSIVADASAPASPTQSAMYEWRQGTHGGNSGL